MTDSPLVISATPTPFNPGGSLDLEGTRRMFAHLADSEVHSLFVAGTTGEFPALSDEERLAIIRAALVAVGPDRVIAHVGAASAYQAARLARAARLAGATMLAAITPYYVSASLSAVRAYYAAVCAEAGGLPVYAYLIPRNTGTEISPAELADLIAEIGLAGAKLSIPGTEFLAEVSRLAPAGSRLYSGNDSLIREVAEAGGHGVVSGVSPACPGFFTDLAKAIGAGDAEAIARHQRLVDAAVAAIGPSAAHLKAALVEQGVLASAYCRMALDPPDDVYRARITAAWQGSP
ncbi:dihydrodipicolinate synthase family protein [Streptosporangiaceae bacterium NEAU-GS5]|nr:dihydrodipicolinate synthase family protein [Streptosporangiaceae bacterium NEAU-GS5]